MHAINGNILVSVDLSQNEEKVIGGNILKSGKNYNENFRERNPVIALVKEGTENIPTGSYIVCNYSHFDIESPLQLTDNLYSIPDDSEIYAIINTDGSLTPVNGNLLVKRLNIDVGINVPEELRKPYINRGILLTEWNGIYANSFIHWLPYSDYQICYVWNGEERRALKIHQSEITGYLK